MVNVSFLIDLKEFWKRTIYIHKLFNYQVKFQKHKFYLTMPSPTHYKFYITIHLATDYFYVVLMSYRFCQTLTKPPFTNTSLLMRMTVISKGVANLLVRVFCINKTLLNLNFLLKFRIDFNSSYYFFIAKKRHSQ
jgi:hypothetical protein